MFWRKKRETIKETSEQPPNEILQCQHYHQGLIEHLTGEIGRTRRKLLRIEKLYERLRKYHDLLPEYRLEILESEMNLWNKRMKYVSELLDGHTISECGHDNCCEIWESFKFNGVDFCPKCGHFFGYNRIPGGS